MSDESIPADPFVNFDREHAFLLFATFCGDEVLTANALGVRPVDVLKAAEEEGWLVKLSDILRLKKSKRPGDFERAMNRSRNFVQAYRITVFLERVLTRLLKMNHEEISDYIFLDNATGPQKAGTLAPAFAKKLSCRALTDLASALEKAHAMTYLALNDTVQDRTRRHEGSDDAESAGDLHVAIAKAMTEVANSNTPRALLLDAQIERANELKAARPPSPHDNDDH